MDDNIIGIILAAGASTRFDSNEHKQLTILNNKPMLCYSLELFNNNQSINTIILCINPECFEKAVEIINQNEYKKIHVIIGGPTRDQSILNAYKYIKDHIKLNVSAVILHDACRPFVTNEMINKLIENIKDNDYVAFTTPLTYDIIRIDEGQITKPLRNQFLNVHCPEIIGYQIFVQIYDDNCVVPIEHKYDHIFIVNHLNKKIKLLDADHNSVFKITFSHDINYLQ